MVSLQDELLREGQRVAGKATVNPALVAAANSICEDIQAYVADLGDDLRVSESGYCEREENSEEIRERRE